MGLKTTPVLDGPQQFFVGFQERRETVEIGRRHLEGLRVRSIPPASDTVTLLAMALIHGFPARGISGIILRVEERSEQKTDESHGQGGFHVQREGLHHAS